MEDLRKAILDFLRINLVYIIGIIVPVVSALWAYRKFLYENKLQKFKDANADLFKANNQEVLAAIATLGVFRRDRRFRKNTIDVLLSRLYTELDYDITNAIANTLIQYENPKDLKYIADELLGINRNFFLQTFPIEQMLSDLQTNWSDLQKSGTNQSPEGETVTIKQMIGDLISIWEDLQKSGTNELQAEESKSAIEKVNSENNQLPKVETENLDLQETKQNSMPRANEKTIESDNFAKLNAVLLKEHLKIYPKSKYELTWHKLVTADTYSRIMRRASREAKLGFFSQNLQKLKLWQTEENRKPKLIDKRKKLKIELYQNDFNYTHLARINTSKCVIDNSALGGVYFTNIVFSKITFKDSTFTKSQFRNCTFKKGVIIGSIFIGCFFDNVTFERINFKESFLWGAEFSNCHFINCKNIPLESFFGVKIDDFSATFEENKLNTFKDLNGSYLKNSFKHSESRLKVGFLLAFNRLKAKLRTTNPIFEITSDIDSIEKSIKELNLTKAWKYKMNCKNILEIRKKEITEWLVPGIVEEWSKEKWLEMVDDSKFSESWDYISAELKSEYTNAEEWHSFLKSQRKEFGEFKSRKLKGYSPFSWETIAFDYESSFSEQSKVVEMVYLKFDEDGKWRISSYTIN